MRPITTILDEEKCTGCAACVNICPTEALSMAPDADGFSIPVLDAALCSHCGQCAQVCPALHYETPNNPNPPCYAFRAAPAIRRESSSGGVFTVLAQYILARNGRVCGVVFDGHWQARLAIASTWEQVMPMRGSKYVQAHAGLIYRKLKVLLEQGLPILFTGTPCHVSALKAFLGRDYGNLFTVDLVCHGVPSPRLFELHLRQIAQGRQITRVAFRDKSTGWGGTQLRLDFADGSSYIGKNGNDAYQTAFYKYLSLRRSCAYCPFSAFPRPGDLSMGDFWSFESLPGGDKDESGTSIVLVNNSKGAYLVEVLAEAGSMCKPMECDLAGLPNCLRAKHTVNPGRQLFFDLARKGDLQKAVDKALGLRFDVGIVGPYTNANVGGFLTYYALYHVVRDLGYTVLLIERQADATIQGCSLENITAQPPYPAYVLARQYPTRLDMRALNRSCDQFLIGSDQLFVPLIYERWGKFYLLDWVENSKKKIAYASSFGHNDVKYSEESENEIGAFLRRFDYFSTRERDGVTICKEHFGFEATHVLDPVFLCDRSHYDTLADQASRQNDPAVKFIMAYMYKRDATGVEWLLADVCDRMGLGARSYPDAFSGDTERINSWLRDMRDCQMLVINSFHGLCFAIIYRKEFILWEDTRANDTRLESLVISLGLQARTFHTLDEYRQRRAELFQPVNYDAVYAKLNPLVETSRAWLADALAAKPRKFWSDYDLAHRELAQVAGRLEKRLLRMEAEMRSQNVAMRRECLKLGRQFLARCGGYAGIGDFQAYLDALARDIEKLIILIAAKDTPANEGSDLILAKLGLSTPLGSHFRQAYLAIVAGGAVICEIAGDDGTPRQHKCEVDTLCIGLDSRPFATGDITIEVSGMDWAVNERGLNMVILDRGTGIILDSVAVDTFDPEYPLRR